MVKSNKIILKVIMIMFVIVALVLPITSYASSTENGGMIVIAPGSASPAPSNPTPSPSTTRTPNVTPTPNNQTKLPQTGIEDYTGLIVAVVILGISAVFAYGKIKEYKNIK